MRPSSSLGWIDQFELVRKLGGGGFGVVYLARDSVSGVEVALKTLHPLLKTNAEEMEHLREKFALIHGLTHPNIAKALVLHPVRELSIVDEVVRRELRLSPGDFVMVMDYAPGVTLSKWRRQFPDGIVPLDIALEVARPIASALDYAHGARIVHRDIKPSNVVVETLGGESHTEAQRHREGGASSPSEPSLTTNHYPLTTSKIRVRILDFGLAAEIRSSMSRISTETGDTSGTRPYMAPEQWLGHKQDGQADQYALACVLYELLSGVPPFSGAFATGDEIIMKSAVKSESPERIAGLSRQANAVFFKALSKMPLERFPTCAAFIEALASAESAPEERPGPPPLQDPWDGESARDSSAAATIRLFLAAVHPIRRERRKTADNLAALEAARTDDEILQILDRLANDLRDDFVLANEGRPDLRRIEPFFHRGAWGNLHAALAVKAERTPVEGRIWHFFRMERAFCRPDR